MIKILTYDKRKNTFSRRETEESSETENDNRMKKTLEKVIKNGKNILAEEEINHYIANGWKLISSSTYAESTNVLGSTAAELVQLNVILYKED